MTKKTKRGLIIVIAVLMLLCSPLLISSISGVSELNDLKYLIDNGREVTGEVVNYTKGTAYGSNNGYTYIIFKLHYEYEENGHIYKDYDSWQISDKYSEKVEEQEAFCKSRIGESIQLIIADNGRCKVAENLQCDYKAQHNFVYIRGIAFGCVEAVMLVALLVVIFYKQPKKEEPCAFITKGKI